MSLKLSQLSGTHRPDRKDEVVMTPQKVPENEFITIWYHPDTKIVHHKIHKNLSGRSFRDALTKGTEILKQNGARKWLSDDRDNTVVNKEDEAWGREVWFGQTQAAGWKYWAIVQPAKVIGQMNIKRIKENFSGVGITAQFFSDPDEAMKWLVSQ